MEPGINELTIHQEQPIKYCYSKVSVTRCIVSESVKAGRIPYKERICSSCHNIDPSSDDGIVHLGQISYRFVAFPM
jgi:hypothetical protein